MRALARWTCCGVLPLSTANARIASIRIDELIARSDEFVVAKVSELLPTSTSDKALVYATGLVQKSLKGSLTGSFMFQASAGWICDTSGAVKDETALFFLGRGSDGTYYIQFAGRSRMPFRQVDGKTYVTLWGGVVLPAGAPTIAGPEPKYPSIKSVELEYLEGLIKKAGRPSAAK